MTKTDIKQAVQKQFGNVAANYSISSVHAKGEDLPKLVEAAELTGQEHVLDAGCGAGHTALACAPHAAQVTACDFTPAMLEQVEKLAAERGITHLTTLQSDVEALQADDAQFDRVVSRYSAHHWPHPQAALHEFARVLKPGGTFVLSDIVAPDDPTQDTFLQTLELLRDPSHVRDHNIAQWKAMFHAAGFVPEVVFTWDVRLDFEDWVKRMATPTLHVSMLRVLYDGAPDSVREAFKIEPDYTFTIPGALIRGRLTP